MHALGKTASTRNLGNTFVYAHPTIGSLAEYVSEFASSAQSSVVRARDLSIQEMKGLVEKYSSNLPAHNAVLPNPPFDGDVVILTGTTGFLGTSLLIELVASPGVKRVYAFNRRGATSTIERQRRALQRRSADLPILTSPKIVWHDVDLQEPLLELSTEVLDDVCIAIFCGPSSCSVFDRSGGTSPISFITVSGKFYPLLLKVKRAAVYSLVRELQPSLEVSRA